MSSVLIFAGAVVLAASDLDEFKVKREAVFEFAKKPSVTRAGDTVTIAFETKGVCDVTVAIEDEQGAIVRHLACGVLGPNAPEPFQKNTKQQAIVWDGKNDKGEYIDEKDRVTVRVSLGLEPRFERALYWTPYKRTAATDPIVVACPEGVLVYEGRLYDMVRLYDHDGGSVRTVSPFPVAWPRFLDDLEARFHDAFD